MDFATWLGDWMDRTGRSSRQVGAAAGVSGPAILRWRAGAKPKLDNLRRLAEHYQLDFPSLAQLAGYPAQGLQPGAAFGRLLEGSSSDFRPMAELLTQFLAREVPEHPELRRMEDPRFLGILLWLMQLDETRFQAVWSMISPHVQASDASVPFLDPLRPDAMLLRKELEALNLGDLPDPIGRLVLFGLAMPKAERDVLLRQAEATWRLKFLSMEEVPEEMSFERRPPEGAESAPTSPPGNPGTLPFPSDP